MFQPDLISRGLKMANTGHISRQRRVRVIKPPYHYIMTLDKGPDKYWTMCLSAKFNKHFVDEVNDRVTFQTNTGPPFKIVVRRTGQRLITVCPGWKEFMAFYGVHEYYSLRLKYKGNAHFKVQIHDGDGNEIDYKQFEELTENKGTGKAVVTADKELDHSSDAASERDNDYFFGPEDASSSEADASEDGEEGSVYEISRCQFRVSVADKRKSQDEALQSERAKRRASSSAAVQASSRTSSATKAKVKTAEKRNEEETKKRTKLSAAERDMQPYGTFILRLPDNFDTLCSVYIPRLMQFFTNKLETRTWRIFYNLICCEVTVRMHAMDKGRGHLSKGVRNFLSQTGLQSGEWLYFEVRDDDVGIMTVEKVIRPQ